MSGLEQVVSARLNHPSHTATPSLWTQLAAGYVRQGVGAIAQHCRTAVASHHRYRRGDGTPGIRLYWHEGFRRPTLASPQRFGKRRGPFAPNFGDHLSPLVVSLLTGQRVVYANDPAKLVALGSVLFALQDGDVVWGAGFARREHVAYATSARAVTYCAVRGPTTQRLLRTHGVACSGPYGDPATLLPLLIHNDIAPQHEIGIVPHWSQFPDFERAIRDPGVKVIDVCDRFDHVARDILSCRLVLSTSLHAVILAESYGIPALLVFYRGHGRGDETKFVDYFESTDRDLYARFVTSASDILQLANEASSVPAPCFRREELLAAFPYAVQARAAEPSLRWSQVQRHMLGCFEAS